jgi:hypothetical protein
MKCIIHISACMAFSRQRYVFRMEVKNIITAEQKKEKSHD